MTKLLMRLSGDRRLLLLFCLLLSLATRWQNFGDWNFEVDDQFYFLVGHRLLAGDLLYVDIFDRKGPALYLTYAVAALFGKSPVSYQLMGTLATALAAYGIARIAAHLGARIAGLVAALAYCLYMLALQGSNGQSPVFYNPLMIACAWAVITRIDLLKEGRIDTRLMAGFGAAGLAIAYKQSALFEGVYFGLAALWLMTRSNAPVAMIVRNGLVLALLGMAPLAITALFYLAIGHFAELWNALAGSVFGRAYGDGIQRFANLLAAGPLFAFVVLALPRIRESNILLDGMAIIWGWIGAALLAIAILPAIYIHYLLPLIAPLCLGALPFLADLRFRTPVAIVACVATVLFSGEWNPRERDRSRAELQAFEDYLQSVAMPNDLLIWAQSSYPYLLADKAPPSRLAFPAHLYDPQESGSSGIDEERETQRILARKPQVVILHTPQHFIPQNNPRTDPLVREYVRACPMVREFTLHDHLEKQTLLVYSDCPQ